MADTSLVFNILAKDKASKAFDKIKLAAAAAFAAGAAAAVAFGKSAIDSAANLAETQSKVGVIFGDSAGAVRAFAEGAAKGLGQSKQQALDAAATFATFGKGAGLAGDDLVGFSTSMTTLASDMASFNNTSPEQAIEAIGAALRGESEPIRAYGVLLDDATLRNEALKLGLIKTTSQALTPQQKVLAAQSAILKQTTAAQGDFGRTSGGLANQSRIMKAELANVTAELGTKLLPAATKVTTWALGAIAWMKEHESLVRNIAAGVAAFGAAIGAVIVVTKAWHGIMILVNAAQKVWLVLTKAAKAATAAWTAVQWLLNTALFANPIGLIILAVAALIAIIVLIATKTRWFQNLWNAAWGWIKRTISGVWDWIKRNWPLVLSILTGPIGAAAVFIIRNWDRIKAGAMAVFNAVAGFVRARVDNIVASARATAHAYIAIRDAFENARRAVVDKLLAAVAFVRGLPGRILGALGNLGRLLYNVGRDIIQGLINGVRDMIGRLVSSVWDAISSIPNTAKRLLGIASPSTLFFGFGQDTVRGYIAGLRSQTGDMTAAAAQISAAASERMRADQLMRSIKDLGPRGSALYDVFRESDMSMRRAQTLYSLWRESAEAIRPSSTIAASSPAPLRGGRTVLEIRTGGSRMDELFAEMLRRFVRIRGGNVQLAVGRNR